MPYAHRRIHDADAHFMETPEWFRAFRRREERLQKLSVDEKQRIYCDNFAYLMGHGLCPAEAS